MSEFNHWHPVADAAALQDQPLAAELLGQSLVLWRDAQGQPHAWADQCPHRGAQLSLGRVLGDRLQCPYHGWEFNGSARCLRVPAMPGFVPPSGHAVRAFEALERAGLLWVCLQPDSALRVALPALAAEDDTRLRKLLCGPYDVQTSAPRIVENFLDMAHFSFVHAHWLGSPDLPQIDDYTVEPTPTGLRASNCRAWQPRSNLHSTQAAKVAYGYEVCGPYTAVLTKVPEPGSTARADWREAIALFICPQGHERSRVWFRLAVADFESPDDTLRAFQHTIFTQDQPVLESQRPRRLPLDARAELHCAVDKSSAAYRRYLRETGIQTGVIP